jgi:hypothetical protein
MSRHPMRSSARSNFPQSAPGSSPLSGRLLLGAIAATLTFALLLPALASAATEHSLEIAIAGTGEGGVGCKVNAGPLEECGEEYEEGTEVAVIAEPETGSEFTEWKGDCDTVVGGECKVEMDADKAIEVVFDLEEFELAVQAEGSGEGVVECQVEGGPYELCPASEIYPYGTEVILFAEAEEGSEFLEWEGDCSSVVAECTLAVEEPLSVTALFKPEPPFELTVETAGTGEGEVSCEVEGGPAEECEAEAEYEEGTQITVIAEPEAGSELAEWSGDCDTVSGNECEVEMDADKTVTATFDLVPTFELEISTEGSGEGEVECEVEAGPVEPCEAEYEEGTEVALVPEAETGSEFTGWSEDCTGTGACELTMDEDKSVTAGFDLEPEEFALEISTEGSGEGEVSCEVESGPVEPCEAEYEEGTEVALVPEAETGSEFSGWSEDCTGTGACELTMDEAHSVTATFDEEEEPQPEEFNLTIVKAGTGSGSVTCNAGACAAGYEEGEEVTLAATAASGSTFTGFSGAGCSGTAPCTVTIEEDTTVTATFTANAKAEETCATNASLCPPPPPIVEGKAKAAATATVKSGKAALKLTCSGGPCKGTIQLKAKVKQGAKTKSLVIGKASFSIAEGATVTLKVKLSGPAKSELAKGKTLKAKTSGAGVSASTVKLKPAKKS